MKIRKILQKKQLSIKEGVIANSIVKYLEVSKFPRNLVLGKLRTKNRELLEKNEKADKLIIKINNTNRSMVDEIKNVEQDNSKLLQRLKENLN